MAQISSSEIRRWRLDANLSQTELAEKLGVSQGLVSAWETGRTQPAEEEVAKLQELFGGASTSPTNVFGEWVKRERERKNLTVSELAEAAGLSAPAIYKIESGDIANPRRVTRDKLAKALGTAVPDDIQKEVSEAASVQGLGEMIDFDPHDEADWPKGPGVYIFYDRANRPVYVGQGRTVHTRIRDHKTRFWYKDPIVSSGSFIEIRDDSVRMQVEKVLIRFLKHNAIINKQHVDSDDR